MSSGNSMSSTAKSVAASHAVDNGRAPRFDGHPEEVRFWRRLPQAAPGSDAALMLDGALLTIARSLLLETKGDGARDKAAAEAARTLAHAHGRAPARDAAAALGALAAHVGVPRDMAQDAARALREEAASLADALQRE